MKDNKMNNIWQVLIKCILYSFIEKSHSKFPFLSLSKTVEAGLNIFPYITKKVGNLYWRLCLLMEKHYEIGLFLDSNLSFSIRVSTYGLANDLHICKKYENPYKHVILI